MLRGIPLYDIILETLINKPQTKSNKSVSTRAIKGKENGQLDRGVEIMAGGESLLTSPQPE